MGVSVSYGYISSLCLAFQTFSLKCKIFFPSLRKMQSFRQKLNNSFKAQHDLTLYKMWIPMTKKVIISSLLTGYKAVSYCGWFLPFLDFVTSPWTKYRYFDYCARWRHEDTTNKGRGHEIFLPADTKTSNMYNFRSFAY